MNISYPSGKRYKGRSMSEAGKENTPLSNIIFISLPEELRQNIGDFEIEPGILIPVETLPGQDEWSINELSWEMIISAMLKILVYDPDNPNRAYYKKFILAAKPGIAVELSNMGVEKAKNKDFEIAEELLTALLNLEPDDIYCMLNLALVYEEHAEVYEMANRSQYVDEYREKAYNAYKNVLQIAPDDENVLFNAGHFYLKQRNFTKANDVFDKFMAVSPDKKKKEAVIAILKELQSRDEIDLLFSEAYDFIRLGKEQEGIEKIKVFLETYPDVWNAWFLLGWAFRKLARYGEGKEAFLKALDLGAEKSDTLNELAICLMELQEYETCRQTLEKALTIEPENIKIISNLGILSLKEDKIDDAKGFFRYVLELDPEDPIAQNYLDFIDNNVE